ncbi:sugar transferase [Euzebya tangerina]|uniref:sugar transferase n=1 Tax=Euzebya tangerina TaxID=591198 RepID=UPI000E31552B|nr:sugar transferase [Euzebya tangerina]
MAPPDDPDGTDLSIGRPTPVASRVEDVQARTPRPTSSPPSRPSPASTADRWSPAPLTGVYVSLIKPLFDVTVAVVLLVALSPVLLAGVIAVRLSLGPDVFFVQRRVGLGGEVFRTYKLRTMDHDRRETSAGDIEAFRDGRWDGIERRNTHKSERDPRLNQVGRLLRTFSIDEIPQLLNVIKGDMSLVGPRPELPGIVEAHYDQWMHRRHAVKPGLTGLWQISERGNGMMHEHVDVDLDYVDSVTFMTDLRILLATPYAALGPRRGF